MREAAVHKQSKRPNPLWAALGALVGLRRHADFEHDATNFKPLHLALVALALVCMFVGGIITLVFFVLN
jgi:hypothetical protein